MSTWWRRHRPPVKGTALGRPIDLRYFSNRVAVAGAGAAGLIALAATIAGDGLDLAVAARVGICVFLAWAIGRELTPDHPNAAAVAMAGAAVLALVDVPAIGVNVVALIAVRAWAGTVGHHPSIFDFTGAVALAAYAGTDPVMWAAAVLLAAGIVTHSPHRVGALGTAALMFVAGILTAWTASPTVETSVSNAEAAALAGVAVLVLAVLPIRNVRSETDRRSLPISGARVGTGWIATLLIVAGVAMFDRIAVAGPLLAAMAAAAVPLIAQRLGSSE